MTLNVKPTSHSKNAWTFGDEASSSRLAKARDELFVGLDIPKQAATEVYNWVQEQDWPEGTELESLEDYHITMLFAQGDGASSHHDAKWIEHESHAVTVKGIKKFPPSEAKDGLHPIVLLVEGETLQAHHNRLAEAAEDAGVDPGPYSKDKYEPHMTIAYGPDLPKGLKPPKFTFETERSSVSTPREASVVVVPVRRVVGEPPEVPPESTEHESKQEPHTWRIAQPRPPYLDALLKFADSWVPKDSWPSALRERNGEPVDAECTCKDGQDGHAKLACPVHGMHPTLPTYDDTLEFRDPASPVGYDYHGDGPRTWMRAETKTAADEADSREYQDSRQMPPMTQEPNATNPHPEKQGCTCDQGLKLSCPVHGLNPTEQGYDHSWSIPEGHPVGLYQQPDQYMVNARTKQDTRNLDRRVFGNDSGLVPEMSPIDSSLENRDHRYRSDQASTPPPASRPYLQGIEQSRPNEDQRRSHDHHNRDNQDDWNFDNDPETNSRSCKVGDAIDRERSHEHEQDTRMISYLHTRENNRAPIAASRTPATEASSTPQHCQFCASGDSEDRTILGPSPSARNRQSNISWTFPEIISRGSSIFKAPQDQPRNYMKAEGAWSFSGDDSSEQDNGEAHRDTDEHEAEESADGRRAGNKENSVGIHDPSIANCECPVCRAGRDNGWSMTGLPRAEGAVEEEDEHEDNEEGGSVQVPVPSEALKKKNRERKDRKLVLENLK